MLMFQDMTPSPDEHEAVAYANLEIIQEIIAQRKEKLDSGDNRYWLWVRRYAILKYDNFLFLHNWYGDTVHIIMD